MGVEILEDLRKSIIDGHHERAVGLTTEAVQKHLPVFEIIQQGIVPGIKTVGELFGVGEYYLPELLVSGKAMQGALEVIEPVLTGTGESFHIGNFLIGTVMGDIHDLGKNIVIMMLKGNGWNVTDLGVDVSPDRFGAAIDDGEYDILGMSTLLTVTMPAAAETIRALKKAGLRTHMIWYLHSQTVCARLLAFGT
ncbi:B12-binding domain-containing protein [Thermodesulfobacteriota bacterium]